MEEKLERYPKKSGAGKWIVVGVIVFVLFLLSQTCFVVTYQNEYKLVKQFGKVEKIISEPGLSFKIPFIQTVDTLPKEILVYDLQPSDVITKDKKTMVCDSYVLWRISDPQLFIQTLNSTTYAEDSINTTVYNAIKNAISSIEQTEVISGRDGELSELISKNIGTTMDQYGIELIAVETKHLDLPSDNKTAVYERMISERNNIAAQYTAEGEAEATKIRTQTDNDVAIKLSEAEAEAEMIIAEGEAEYMRILSTVYGDESRSEFYTFVRALDAAKASLVGKNKTVILSEDSPMADIFNNIQ
ncbi:MAG: protease modulator HflC [Lachnospiraceae bacterium]|nr:protease modulator HflC [Lachnospiraceae bacterium]